MSQTNGLNRRAFLRNAGLTALAGAAAGTHAPLLAATADTAPATQAANGTVRLRHRLQPIRHRFDQVRSADQSLRQGQRAGRDGHCRHRLQGRAVDHQCDRCAREARELGLPRHGYVDAAHERGGGRVEQAALRRDDRSQDGGARQRRAPGAHRRAQDLLAEGLEGAAADADLQRLLQRPHRVRDEGRGKPAEVRQREVPDGLRRLRAPHQLSTPTRSSSATRRTRPATAGRRKICCASARSASSIA